MSLPTLCLYKNRSFYAILSFHVWIFLDIHVAHADGRCSILTVFWYGIPLCTTAFITISKLSAYQMNCPALHFRMHNFKTIFRGIESCSGFSFRQYVFVKTISNTCSLFTLQDTFVKTCLTALYTQLVCRLIHLENLRTGTPES